MSEVSKLGSPPAPQERDPRLLKAAQMYEEHFLREMVKAMRRTVPESDLVPTSMAENIFKQQLDEQYVEQWVMRGGLGFADVVYNNISERLMPQQRPEKPQGPININQKEAIKLKDITPKANSQQGAQYRIEGANLKSLHAPWSGTVSGRQLSEQQLNQLTIKHDNGLTSNLLFNGVSKLREGEKIQPGQVLASLPPDSNVIYWRLKST